MRSDSENEILRKRAIELARDAAKDAPISTLSVIEFTLGKERLALESRFLREVHHFHNLTILPGTPPFLAGIVNVRGQLLPVINIQVFLNLPRPGITDMHTILVISSPGMELGLLADTVVGIYDLPVADIRPGLPTFTSVTDAHIHGITAGRLVVLDIEKILSDPALKIHQDVES